MAWVKIPPENHPLFRDALPKDTRVSTIQMFGGVAGLVNGNMFGGLFGRSIVARLDPVSQREALALDGAVRFDPMGAGRVMRDTVFFPESVMDEPEQLRSWLQRALDFTSTLPKKKKVKKPSAAKPKPKKPPAAKAKPRKGKPK
jgi:TfoX/Sxy family transcriptional regulator of competence genes